MRHLSALKRVSDGRWDYTTNGHPTGYCREYAPIKEYGSGVNPEAARGYNQNMLPFVKNFHTDGHETEQEACDCYRKYILDTSLRLTPEEPVNASQQTRCRICNKFTACHSYVGAYNLFVLCPEHQTRECVESLYSVGESWES